MGHLAIQGAFRIRRAKVRYFNREDAAFREEEVDFELEREGPDATNLVRLPADDRDQARQVASARKRDAERDMGGGLSSSLSSRRPMPKRTSC
ncbi:hypothetical protein [Amorphus suaedae]